MPMASFAAILVPCHGSVLCSHVPADTLCVTLSSFVDSFAMVLGSRRGPVGLSFRRFREKLPSLLSLSLPIWFKAHPVEGRNQPVQPLPSARQPTPVPSRNLEFLQSPTHRSPPLYFLRSSGPLADDFYHSRYPSDSDDISSEVRS